MSCCTTAPTARQGCKTFSEMEGDRDSIPSHGRRIARLNNGCGPRIGRRQDATRTKRRSKQQSRAGPSDCPQTRSGCAYSGPCCVHTAFRHSRHRRAWQNKGQTVGTTWVDNCNSNKVGLVLAISRPVPSPAVRLNTVVCLVCLVSQCVSRPVITSYPGGRSARWVLCRAGARTDSGFGYAVSSPICCRTLLDRPSPCHTTCCNIADVVLASTLMLCQAIPFHTVLYVECCAIVDPE